ncbi:MAG: flagellar basal body M-ring protein FliF, partial [Blastocatellia bacterium]|nr:flagellar basal body M-ring protein FliF [Blastocatellia bacterium]
MIALLEPVIGENRVRADVSADVDFSQVEQTEEKYNPQSQVVRSQQNSNETRNSPRQNLPLAVGARANDPTAPPPAGANTANTQQANNLADQRASTTTNYEIDKTTKKTIGGGGRVNRLTV